MATNKSNRARPRGRKSASSFTTHNGNVIKIKRSRSDKRQANKEAKARRKAIARSTLPNNFFLRQVYRLDPKRMFHYWFSRDGVLMALKVVGVTVIVCFVLLIGLFAYFRKDLPKINSIAGEKLGGSITYYDRTGKVALFRDYDAVKRVPVEPNQISPYLKNATIAIEDQNFYNEGAFSLTGIARAGLHDVLGIGSGGGGGLQGGSTITQQLVKLNEKWDADRTLGRKIKELILAIDLNREYSKDEILSGYLNIAPYGGVEYGCETAARDFFHTSCAKLTLPQAAMMAAIPQSPSSFSPYMSPEWSRSSTLDNFNEKGLLSRKDYVLFQMHKLGMITQKQMQDAQKVDILAEVKPFETKTAGIKYPYFVLTAKQALEDKYGAATVQRGGWKVITTLNVDIQDKALSLVASNLPAVERAGGDTEAMVIENVPTGQIEGLVGGTDFSNKSHGQINFASSVKIAPGSSIKPYVYASLIDDSNAGAGSVLYDSQGPIPGYPCTNKRPPSLYSSGGNCLWDDNRTYPGAETLRYALGGSRNVPAVKAFVQAGIQNTQKTISEMMNPNANSLLYNCYSNEALTKPQECYSAAGIGDGAYLHLDDHANGLSTLGRLGKSVPKTYILKITDAAGKTVDEWHQPEGKQAIKAQTAYIINNMLSDPKASYFNYSAKIQNWNGWDFAIKTGTTNNASNYLMTGYSTQYAVVSWAGYHTTVKPMTGSSDTITYALTAPMLKYLHEGKKPINWQEPEGIQHLPAFVMYSGKGMMFGAQFPSPKTDIFPSWYKPKSGAGQTIVIDKVSARQATSCTPDLAKTYIVNGGANKFSIDQFFGNGNTDATNYDLNAFDDVHSCNDIKPSVSLTVAPDPCDDKSGCVITATVSQGTYPLSSSDFPGRLTFSVNGNAIKSFGVSQDGQTVSYTWKPDANGTAKISATVTDSVLYAGSRDTSVTTKATKKLKFISATTHGISTTISWSGGGGSYTVAQDSQGTEPLSGCENVSGDSCTTIDDASGGFYIIDNTGQSTPVRGQVTQSNP